VSPAGVFSIALLALVLALIVILSVWKRRATRGDESPK